MSETRDLSGGDLSGRIAAQIAALVAEGELAPGARLPERMLAARFRVSRSPVRGALEALTERGVTARGPDGGFVVAALPADALAMDEADPADEGLYRSLINDRLDGRLDERISENELLRRYGASRGRLMHVLRRAASEGWMERLPGHGWAFSPVLTSLAAYGDGYRFRLAIEPAAILEPGFRPQREALLRRREEQLALIAGRLHTASDAEVFRLNSGLHETIVLCSQNSFFIDALNRVNRLRQLMEHRRRLAPATGVERCHEHVEILDLLLSNRRPEAAEMMRDHLGRVGPLKSR